VGSNLLVAVSFGHDLAPCTTGLLDGGDHLLAGFVGGLSRHFELLSAVRALHDHSERPQPGVDETSGTADLIENPVAHLGGRTCAV
jgi:hypothetical protein